MAKITPEEAKKLLRGDSASCRIWQRKDDLADLIRDMDNRINKLKSCAGCDQCLNLCCPGQEGGK